MTPGWCNVRPMAAFSPADHCHLSSTVLIFHSNKGSRLSFHRMCTTASGSFQSKFWQHRWIWWP